MNESLIYLIDVKNKKYQELGKVDVNKVNFNDFEEILKPYCDKFIEQLKDDKMIFIVDKVDGEFKARFRATYADWMETDDIHYPYYFDVAEHDERVFCECILEGTDWH